MKTLTLDFKISNCQYRCLHCDGAKHDRCGHIPVQKIKEAALLYFLRHKGLLFEQLHVFRIGPIEKTVNEGYSLV